MSNENVELVHRGVENVEAFWAMLDPDVVWDLGALLLTDLDPVYTGREAVIKASRHYWGTWDDYQLDAEEVIDGGSKIVIAVRERMRGRSSGVPWKPTGLRSGRSTRDGSSAGSCSPTGLARSKPPGCLGSRFGREAARSIRASP